MWVFLTICIVGFIVLLVSFVLGEIAEHGGEVIHDLAADQPIIDHGGEVDHAGGGPSILSVRILAGFVTGFGGAGAISSYGGLPYGWSSLMGIGVGFVMVAIIYAIASFLYRQQASSGINVNELVDKMATVTISIPKDGAGEVTLTVKGATISQVARAENNAAIPYGQTILIKKVVGNQVIVGLIV